MKRILVTVLTLMLMLSVFPAHAETAHSDQCGGSHDALYMPRLTQIADDVYDSVEGFDVMATNGLCGEYYSREERAIVVVPSHAQAHGDIFQLTTLRQPEGGYIGVRARFHLRGDCSHRDADHPGYLQALRLPRQP